MLESQHLKRPPLVTAASSSSSLGLRPPGSLVRPAISRSGSSSSSLSGMEQSVLPFQEFIKRTRAVETEKPLPPTPLASRHSFDSSRYSEEKRSQLFDLPGSETDRRSSSVYSRTQSEWFSEVRSLHDLSLDDDTYLQSEYYNMHKPEVNTREPTPEFMEPREFSPLIASPSPTLSAVSSLPKSRPPTLTLDSPLVRERPKVRMMSLDKANRTFNAPGAVHLLPEELRAQSSKKSEARKYTRTDSQERSPRPPPLPPAAFDYEFERSQSISTGASVSPCSPAPRDSAQRDFDSEYQFAMNTFPVGTGPARTMAPPSLPASPRRSEEDEQRGRTRQRGRSSRDFAPPQKFYMHDLNPRAILGPRGDAYGRPATPESYNSEDDVRGHMKLIPQPLFQAKSPTVHRPSDAGSPSSLGYSPFRMQRNSQESTSTGRSSGFPLRLSLTPPPGGMRHRQSKSSTTGMIPISPPSENDSMPNHKPSTVNIDHKPHRPLFGHDARVSSVYPHIMSRSKKQKDRRADSKTATKRPSVGAPLLPADVVAAVLLTPETTPQNSPLASDPALTSGLKKTPSAVSADGKRALYQRFRGITKHVRGGTKQQELSPEISPASPQSPHLFPSPVKALQSTHLGWSESAKATWDQARSTAFPSRKDSTKATSPDAGDEVEDSDGPITSRPTLFGPFMESYRETKAQKRREGLKKMIKVVTPLDQPSKAGESDNESDGDSVIQTSLSKINWM